MGGRGTTDGILLALRRNPFIVHRMRELVRYVLIPAIIGGAVGLAMLEAAEPITQDYLDESEWQVDIAGRLYPACASLRPLYDTNQERVRS